MIQPQHILEIGTFTGYSAICLAEGLQKNGKLITIDSNEETSFLAKQFVEKSNMQHQIECMIGDAKKIITSIDYEFDIVFIDADKTAYELYADLVFDKVKTGGYIIADNVLFHGEVINEEKMSKNAKAMHEYNKKMCADNRLENVLLPLRDGLLISRKK